MVTFEGLPFNSSKIFLSYLAVQKIDAYIAKQCSHVRVSLFCNGFTLGPMAQATRVAMKEGSLFCFVCTYEIHRTGML